MNILDITGQAEIETLINAIHSGDTTVEGESEREFASASASASWGPTGGNMHGWLTYAGAKVYFEATSTHSRSGLFYAGGGIFHRNAALKAALLDGKVGTFEIETVSGGRPGERRMYFQMFVDGKPVLEPRLLFLGVGDGDAMKGSVKFTLYR